MPFRKVISQNLVPSTYEKCKLAVSDIVKNVGKICLTTDTWTSLNNEGYIAITGHFLTDDFVLKSVLLECILIEGSLASEHLASEIKKKCLIFMKFPIESWSLFLIMQTI